MQREGTTALRATCTRCGIGFERLASGTECLTCTVNAFSMAAEVQAPEPEPTFRLGDEIAARLDGGIEPMAAEGMFVWHLKQTLRWSAALEMTPTVLLRKVRRALDVEPAKARPQRTRRITDYTRALVLARDGMRCRQCGSTRKLHIDHIHPYSRGGSDAMRNLQTLCQTCNLTKSAKITAQKIAPQPL